MRLLIRLLTALALVSLALPAAAQDKVRLLLDWFVNPDHAALVIAKQRGIFTRHGLDVELIAPADPNAPPKLVAAGQAEYAVSYQPTLQMLAAEGLPLVRVGVLVAQPLNSLVALEDGPVKSIADFKGRKIGYSIAGFEEALLGAILEKAGLTLKDVTLINVNFALTTALMSKQVDGVIGAFRNFELNDLALHKAKGRLWEVEKNGVPTYDELI
ncbi:MAG TPA: ABC transporter substrate-binding protein, partial [Reyranella sp.]